MCAPISEDIELLPWAQTTIAFFNARRPQYNEQADTDPPNIVVAEGANAVKGEGGIPKIGLNISEEEDIEDVNEAGGKEALQNNSITTEGSTDGGSAALRRPRTRCSARLN